MPPYVTFICHSSPSTVKANALVTFPKILLVKFWTKYFRPNMVTWPIYDVIVTWPKFSNFEKIILGASIIYRWKASCISFPTSPQPTLYLNPFKSYGSFSTQHQKMANLKMLTSAKICWRHEKYFGEKMFGIYSSF